VEKIPDEPGRNKKILLIADMLTKRADSLKVVAGITPDMAVSIIANLQKDFGTVVKKAPREPGAPPPKHLLVKAEAGRLDGQPSTPPDGPAGVNDPQHRTATVPRGVLKRRGKKGNPDIRMSTLADLPAIETIQIVSYRTSGDTLWFQAPGSTVNCDRCERGVAQSMGALQGAPGHSQFAQDEFLCSDCIQHNFQMQ